MNPSCFRLELAAATDAALAAGQLMRAHFRRPKRIERATQHDIKLELDVRCQKRIERILRRAGPDIALVGEEGMEGRADAQARWVVDPIDGTVNFAYGIPHACVSIALQTRSPITAAPGSARAGLLAELYQSVLGVVYDPFCDELWTGLRGGPARLNGRVIRVSERHNLCEAVVSIGFSKTRQSLNRMLPAFVRLVHRVRKIRMMGAAALGLVYVASGRMDAYLESGLRLWDVAAGGLIVECAGGEFWRRPLPAPFSYQVLASNGRLRAPLRAFLD